MLAKLQADFIASLKKEKIEGVVGEQLQSLPGISNSRALDIYRHNICITLVEALKNTYPMTYKAMGEEAFSKAAFPFARRHYPSSKVCLLKYHPSFAQSLACADKPYIKELARLEYYISTVSHAANENHIDEHKLVEADTAANKLALVNTAKTFHSSWNITCLYDTLKQHNLDFKATKTKESTLVYRNSNYEICIYKLTSLDKVLLELAQRNSIDDAFGQLSAMGFANEDISRSLFELLNLQVLKTESIA
jgi:hypothetical protein